MIEFEAKYAFGKRPEIDWPLDMCRSIGFGSDAAERQSFQAAIALVEHFGAERVLAAYRLADAEDDAFWAERERQDELRRIEKWKDKLRQRRELLLNPLPLP